MKLVFYFFSIVAVIATLQVIIHAHPLYALLYLVISLLAISCSFFSLGAYFAGALEIIIYAGAIMVLFIFLIMMLNTDNIQIKDEFNVLRSIMSLGAIFASILLLMLLLYSFCNIKSHDINMYLVDARNVGLFLFGPYLLVVEIASMLLLSGLIVVLHLGQDK
ncbi:NADH-quinone oxidoreductase subunit J [Blochmannia endosymbiont of Camponotus (Colobopsis) obliquus]|nr:NADH-quinone oxidoreductase subunit J [Blochmannia endosymbiont of Camponotus (Colobopsis) obliquus]